MFIHNKYSRWYFSIINYATQQRKDRQQGYHESHHIIPKSLGGQDVECNLVTLTPREHFICHKLLVKMTRSNAKRKMSYALWGMANQDRFGERYRLTSQQYSNAKEEMQLALSKDRKGKTLEELYGIDRAREIKNTLKSRRPRSSPSTEERVMASQRMKELHKTRPWKRNFEKGPPPKKMCPHCNKKMDIGNFARWHGDKCRQANPA